MKHQQGNPLFPHCGRFLTSAGRYPAAHVDVFWNHDDEMQVKEVEAVLAPRQLLRDRDLRIAYGAWNKTWSSDLGVSSSDWMQPGGLTPAKIFGHLLRCGFISNDELVNAVREFAHIEECDWARDMLAALD